MLAAPTDAEREVLGISAGSATRWCCTAIRAGCRSASAPGQLELSPERRGFGPGLRHLQHEYSPGLPAGTLFCVTLNPDAPVDDRYVWQRFVYEHPLFNPQSWSAQLRREEINGQQRSWYCGAYWYNGFHEDGVRSALDVVQGIAAAEGK